VRTTDIVAKIIDATSFSQELQGQHIYFFGNGADKCQSVITSSNAHFIHDILPQAQFMGQLAAHSPQLDIKQIAYYEPFYLKEFVAAPSHIKGLETK
jgi:tRNA threonylcarbamoyladenosine biosynthesis protein TsaB